MEIIKKSKMSIHRLESAIESLVKERQINWNSNVSTRLFVIENTIIIEEFISTILGNLLGIDWVNSKSLGSTSKAISFNQKITIIQDIKSVDKLLVRKLTRIMEIRNKFAHNYKIKEFSDLFEVKITGNEIKKNLDTWYGETDQQSDKNYNLYFEGLINDVINSLSKINAESIHKEIFNRGRTDFRETLLDELIGYILSLDNGQSILEEKVKESSEKVKNPFHL